MDLALQDTTVPSDSDHGATAEASMELQAEGDVMEQIATALDQLNQDRSNYNTYIQLITLLRQVDMPEELEQVRVDLHENFPLYEQMYLDWINDIKQRDLSQEKKDEMLRRVYDWAADDYLSIPIWESFANYVVENYQRVGDVIKEETRRDLLKAVAATNNHVAESQRIWTIYADFIEDDLMKKVYLERLKVLHMDCADTFSRYSTWVTEHDNANYEETMLEANKIYAKTKAAVADREFYEQALKDSGYALDRFYTYIEFEKSCKKMSNVGTVRNLYERAITIYCMDVNLWEDYIHYMMQAARIPTIVTPIAARAVRNCPWSGSLWSHYARFLESGDAPKEDVYAVIDKALADRTLVASLEDLIAVLTTKCDYARRRVDWQNPDTDSLADLQMAFEEALIHIGQHFPDGDPYYRVEKYYATVMSKRFGDYDKGKELWQGIVQRHGKSAQAWLEFIQFERSLGHVAECQQLFRRAMSKNVDYPQQLMAEWTTFEHEYGTLESLESTMVRVYQKNKSLAVYQQRVEERKESVKLIKHKQQKGAHRSRLKENKKARRAEEQAAAAPAAAAASSETEDHTMTEASNADSTRSNKRKRPDDDMDVDEQTTTDQPHVADDDATFKKPSRPIKKAKMQQTRDLAKEDDQDQQHQGNEGDHDEPARSSISHRGRGARGRGRPRNTGRGRPRLGTGTSTRSSASSSETPETRPQTNDDFRALLLGKKK
ncbi:hypothetical protein BC940DRAFT_301110 [Gongronella butleri]|nr:hypothetical protein BC940DRAFT_301110 [Gongronella butleri]